MTATLAAETIPTESRHRTIYRLHPRAQPRRAESPGGPANRDCPVNLMTVTERTDGAADNEALHQRAERGLRRYAAQTAKAVGIEPEAVWCEWADARSAYVPLDHRLPEQPHRDTALVWTPEHGWAITVETGCGEDMLIIASLDGDVLPAPDTVAAWVRAVVAGQDTGKRACPRTSAGDTNLARRLASWARHELTVDDKTS